MLIWDHEFRCNGCQSLGQAPDHDADCTKSVFLDRSGDLDVRADRSALAADRARQAHGKFDVYVRDRRAETTRQVSVGSDGTKGNRTSGWPSMSADGKYVAFQSNASNLVPGDANDMYDLFVRGPLR